MNCNMLAVVWFIPVLWGAGILCGCVAAWWFYRWLISDPKRDMVIFMGPKNQGKTEFKSALLQEDFNPNRVGTGKFAKPDRFSIEEDDLGCKKFVTFDSDGAGNNIRDYVSQLRKYMNQKMPEYVLVVLVMSIDMVSEAVEAADKMGEYLDYITQAFGEDLNKKLSERYLGGKWAYAIAVTHCAKVSKAQERTLSEIAKNLESYKGNLRRLDDKGIACFELSESGYRRGTLKWIANHLKEMHRG